MTTLRGMAEQRFSNVYNYQCLTLVLYLCHGRFGLQVEVTIVKTYTTTAQEPSIYAPIC